MIAKVQVWIGSRQSSGGPRFLLLKTRAGRAGATEKRGSFWQPVTGAVEPSKNETLEEAAARELQEETAFLADQSKRSIYPVDFSFEYPSAHSGRLVRETVFYFEMEMEDDPVLDPQEHEDCEWLSVKEVVKRLSFDSHREAFQKILKKFFGDR